MNDWSTEQADGPEQVAAGRPQRSLIGKIVSFLLHQLAALVLFVGIPALVTAIAPVSWVKFERRDGTVSAKAQTCLLFVVPYKTQAVSPVVGIGDRFVGGSYTRKRRPGRDRVTKSEDEGFLIIQGVEEAAEVSVTPHDLKSVIERSEAFLHDSQAAELKLFVVANWKFSVIGGGLISLLTVLYVVSIVGGGAVKLIRVYQWALGIPPERRLFAKLIK
jgi:hypothetical protein